VRTRKHGSAHLITMPNCVRIVLSGDIDAELATELTEITAEAVALQLPVEIDAHHITYLDSTGVAFLTDLAGQLAAPPKLLHVPPTLAFLLEATHTRELFSVGL